MAKKAMKTAAAAAAKKKKLRVVSDFLDFAWDWGTNEWVVLAVEAPIALAAPAYRKLVSPKPQRVLESVPVRPATKLGVISYLVPVVQVAGSAWTTIHRVVGLPIGMADVEDADRIASKLSAELKTRAAVFMGEDTSGAMGVSLFDKGKKGASKEWDQELDVADGLFAKLGLTVPACHANELGKEPVVVAASADWAARIERADLFDFGEE